MRKKLVPFLGCLLIFACSSAYSQRYAAYEINSPRRTKLPHVVNPQKILSEKEEYQLNMQLDSIEMADKIDIVFVFISQTSRKYKENDSFAAELGTQIGWKNTHYRQNFLIFVYTQANNKLGYWMSDSLKEEVLFEFKIKYLLDEERVSSLQKKQYSSGFHNIITKSLVVIKEKRIAEINEQKRIEEEEEKIKQAEVERIAQIRDKIWLYDILLGLVILVLAIYLTILWLRRKIRMVYRNYTATKDINDYLDRKVFFMGCFFIAFFYFSYKQFLKIISIHPEYFYFTKWTIIVIVALAWIPSTGYISLRRPTSKEEDTPPISQENTPQQDTPPSGKDSKQKKTSVSKNSEKININKASAEQLRNLSPLMTLMDANRIIQEKKRRGDYVNSQDLGDRTQLQSSLVQEISQGVLFEPSNLDNSPRGRVLDI